MDRDSLRRAVFHLCYTQHGGSGLGLSLSDAYELPIGELNAFLLLLEEQRDQEAAAIKRAHQGK